MRGTEFAEMSARGFRKGGTFPVVSTAKAGAQGPAARRLPWVPAFAQGCPGKV
jgi:hypothetical protein